MGKYQMTEETYKRGTKDERNENITYRLLLQSSTKVIIKNLFFH